MCTLVVVHYRFARCWILYPHGAGKLRVILNEQDATTLAQASPGAADKRPCPALSTLPTQRSPPPLSTTLTLIERPPRLC
ncbi:MAG: hypothetical protein ACRDS9_04095 [Pseudonocardiaceae bacterium]